MSDSPNSLPGRLRSRIAELENASLVLGHLSRTGVFNPDAVTAFAVAQSGLGDHLDLLKGQLGRCSGAAVQARASKTTD